MKWKIAFLLAYSTASFAGDLKVLTFNAGLVCLGPNCVLAEQDKPRERAPLIGQWLKNMDPDIAFLQEVVRAEERETIRRESGMSYVAFAQTVSGLAIYSKHPLKNISFEPFHWQASTWHDSRRLFVRWIAGILKATVVLPDRKEMTLVTTHQLPRWPEYEGFNQPADIITPERKINVIQMQEAIRPLLSIAAPFLFAGDFNMNQDSAEYPFFSRLLPMQDLLRWHAEKSGLKWGDLCTFCPDNPFVRNQKNPGEKILDYIWASSGDFDVVSTKIIQDQDTLSDHRPVVAIIRPKSKLTPHSPLLTRVPLTDLQQLQSYIEGIKIHPYCWFTSPAAWTERSQTRAFLESLINRGP